MSHYRKSDAAMSTEERISELESRVDKYSKYENSENRGASIEKTKFGFSIMGIVFVLSLLCGVSYSCNHENNETLKVISKECPQATPSHLMKENNSK